MALTAWHCSAGCHRDGCSRHGAVGGARADFDPAWDDGESPVRAVRYVYWKTGDVANIIIKDEGEAPVEDPDRYAWHRSLAFYYTTSGQVWQVLWDRWQADEDGEVLTETYQRLAAREFRYDSPRARYMSRPVNTSTFVADALSTWEWTDYAGDEPYGDFSVALNGSDFPVATHVTRFLGGFGTHAKQTVAGGVTTYLHDDLIGSTVLTTDAGGAAASTTAYSAWGERVTASSAQPWTAVGTRYAFAGGWGYESGLITLDGSPGTAPVTLQHLGARWYQPEIGRFVQRDPIGLGGGTNTYEYVSSSCLQFVDPEGEASLIANPGAIALGPGLGAGLGAGAVGTAVSATGVGALVIAVGFCNKPIELDDELVRQMAHRKGKSKSKLNKHQKGEARYKQSVNDRKRSHRTWRQHGGTDWILDEYY